MKLRPPSRAASLLTVAMLLLVATTIFAQQLAAPKTDDEKTARLVSGMISSYHISQPQIGDEASQELLNRYLKDLDPQKLYFLQSDIDVLMKQKTELDDLVKAGNVDFAYQTFDTYLKRLDERIALVHKLIDAEHDFTVDETMVIDAEQLDWAKSDRQVRERWRKRIKYDLLSLKLEDTELEQARNQLHKRYRNIKQMMHQTEDSEKLEMYLNALAHTFDPHSSYMSPQTLEDFQISMRLRLQGIGAALRSEDGYTIVAQIVPGGAADKDGRLKVSDKITGVDSGDGEMRDVVEMKLSKVVRFIRGPKGTSVRLKVKPADGGDVVIYELTRQVIELQQQAVRGEIIDAGERIPGAKGRVGVIHIPSFYRDFSGAQQGVEDFRSTARDVLKVLKEFYEQGGVDAVIVDLRTNGGGALSESIEVSGLFIDHGPVVQVKEQGGVPKVHKDTVRGAVYTGPLVVVCNRLSASASEIFAGAIKDYKRGIIVGDSTTHGKGSVQNVMPVGQPLLRFLNQPGRGALKLTINLFYRVNGASTQNRGVQSDIVLPSLMDHMDLGESFLEHALAFDKINSANFEPDGQVTPKLVAALKQGSEKRVAADTEFTKLKQDIERFVERKNRKSISLNEEVLRAERQQDKKREKEKDEPKKDENGNPPVFPKNFYNNELLNVAVDYISHLKGVKTAGN